MLTQYLPKADQRQLVLITGARQNGKTTLVKHKYSALPYYNLDAIEYRSQLGNISTFRWADEIGASVIDEIQKEPGLFDKIKYSYDEGSLNFSVLTGSSQLLLLKKSA
jgi:predicted AAA+ superfamily ATPase